MATFCFCLAQAVQPQSQNLKTSLSSVVFMSCVPSSLPVVSHLLLLHSQGSVLFSLYRVHVGSFVVVVYIAWLIRLGLSS